MPGPPSRKTNISDIDRLNIKLMTVCSLSATRKKHCDFQWFCHSTMEKMKKQNHCWSLSTLSAEKENLTSVLNTLPVCNKAQYLAHESIYRWDWMFLKVWLFFWFVISKIQDVAQSDLNLFDTQNTIHFLLSFFLRDQQFNKSTGGKLRFEVKNYPNLLLSCLLVLSVVECWRTRKIQKPFRRTIIIKKKDIFRQKQSPLSRVCPHGIIIVLFVVLSEVELKQSRGLHFKHQLKTFRSFWLKLH